MAEGDSARLTVGLPVRNGEAYLPAALENLLGADVDGLHLVISDNASTDATADIALEAASRDRRVEYRRQPFDIGANANFNAVFDGCRSGFFKWAAVDDLCDPDLLASCLTELAAGDVVLAHGRPKLIDDAGAVLVQAVAEHPTGGAADPLARWRDVLYHEVWCTPIFGVIRSAALGRSGLLRPFYGADKVLLAELALQGRFVEVAPPFYRRCHDEQSTVLDARAKARWTVGRSGPDRVPAALRAMLAYLEVAQRCALPWPARQRATASAVRLTVRPDKLRKALLPGPYNYFGWTGSRAHAYEGLDLTPAGLRVNNDGTAVALPPA